MLSPVNEEGLQKLDDALLSRTFLLGTTLSLADLVLFGVLHRAVVRCPGCTSASGLAAQLTGVIHPPCKIHTLCASKVLTQIGDATSAAAEVLPIGAAGAPEEYCALV